jgi:hypothetical protein
LRAAPKDPQTKGAPFQEPLFLGSSPNSGEGGLYFEEEVFVVEKTVGHSLYHLDLVVDTFE